MTAVRSRQAEINLPAGRSRTHPGYGPAKRLIDIVGATLGLLIVWPILLICAVLIKLDSPGPIIHKRQWMRKGGRKAFAYKLRTMIADADRYLDEHPDLQAEFAVNFKLKVDPRVTRVGKQLRRLSLDELPQLVNVLRGEMSLVGPRMVSFSEAEKYGDQLDKLLSVRPGITGLWQVSGRQEVGYEQRVRLDMAYIDSRSLWLDLKIILMTIPTVLAGRGAY
ncbi:MAG: sugar transferase [Dehalococcoidia bacterium]|jgi:lipopolysaccharide/colanic/teichoic acid biosynthesis glycosyltransferase